MHFPLECPDILRSHHTPPNKKRDHATEAQSRPIPIENLTNSLSEAADGVRFFFVDVENGVELGDLQQIFHPLGQTQKFERAARV